MSAQNPRPELPAEALERELRLRELTDQTLLILDQLAEAREKILAQDQERHELLEERDQLRHELSVRDDDQIRHERALENMRRFVRAGRSLSAHGPRETPADAISVVFWAPAAVDIDVANVAQQVTHLAGMPCTFVAGPERSDAELAPLRAIEGLEVLAADRGVPAQLFNLAMSATQAAVVLFAVDGCDFAAGGLDALGQLTDRGVGIGVPVTSWDGATTLGRRQGDAFVLEDNDPADEAAMVAPDPAAFFLRRKAYETMGPFDENFSGLATIVDYVKRFAGSDYLLVPAPGCTIEVSASRRAELDSILRSVGSRLLLTARYERSELPERILAAEELWELPVDQLVATLREVYANTDGTTPETASLFVEHFAALVRRVESPAVVAARLRRLDAVIEEFRGVDCAEFSPALSDLERRLETEGAATSEDVEAKIAAFEHRLRIELEIKKQLREIIGAVRSELVSFVNSHEDLKEHLEKGQVELRSLAETQNAALHRADKLEAQLEERTAQLAERTGQRDALEGRRFEIEAAKVKAEEQAAALDTQREDAERRLAAMTSELDAARHQLKEVEAEFERFQAQVETAGEAIADALAFEGAPSLEALCGQARETHRTLENRNEWIASLLEEIRGTRFRVRPRRLSSQELSFLASHRPANGESE